MGNQEILVRVRIRSGDGVKLGLVQGWPRVIVKIGLRGIEIWDDRKESRKALEKLYGTYQELADVKRHKKIGTEPEEVRQKRSEARKKFWETFQSPAEVVVEEKPVAGGEWTIPYLTLYDTNEDPEKILRVHRTFGRWTRDPSFSPIRSMPDEKGNRWLHLVISSLDSPVDIIEKTDDGIVTQSVRFTGEEEVVHSYTERVEKKKEVEKEKEEEIEFRDIPPVDYGEETPIDPEKVAAAQAALQAATNAKGKEDKNKKRSKKKGKK